MNLKKLLLIAFAISGMTALIYEIVWVRPLQLIFGSTIYAVSTMLTTFFVGFTLGSYIFRNLSDRVKNPVLMFSFLELGIGLYGLIILYLFKILPRIYTFIIEIPELHFLQFILVFLVLIIPSTLFGATWPVVGRMYISQDKFGKDTGEIYSFNSFGAFAGSIISGFVLIPLFGIKVTSIFVAFLNILIAIVTFVYFKTGGKNEL